MAGVKETATWENHVYQIEENDPVHGGEEGVTNKPIKHLANRTLYLRKLLSEAGQRITPKKITGASKNSVDLTGHTHEIESASTSAKGLVQLTNDTGLDSEVLALTAKAGKALAQSIAQAKLDTTNGLNKKVDKTSISDAVNSTSQTTVASSRAAKTAYDKGVEAKNAADTANNNANSRVKQAGAYAQIEVDNDGYAGLNIIRSGTSGSWSSRFEALPDRRWKFWTNSDHNGYEQFIKAENGTFAFLSDITNALNSYIPNSQKSNAVDSTSTNTVATSRAVKLVFDRANTANQNAEGRVSKSGDTMTGNLLIKSGGYSSVRTYNNTGESVRWEIVPTSENHMAAIVLADTGERVVRRVLVPRKDGILLLDNDSIVVDNVGKNADQIDSLLTTGNSVASYHNKTGEQLPAGAYSYGTVLSLKSHHAHAQLIFTHANQMYLRNYYRGNSIKPWIRIDGADWQDIRNNPLTLAGSTSLTFDGQYLGVSVSNNGYGGINIKRQGSAGNWDSRLEALPDKRWKFWTQGAFDVYIPAKAGTVVLDTDGAVDATANTYVKRDAAGDVIGRLFRATYQDENRIQGAIAFRVNNSNDNYTRYCNNPVAIRTWLGLKEGVENFCQKLLATSNLNDVVIPGIYGQELNGNATSARNYPEGQAGSLIVSLSAYGVQQEYTTYSSRNKYVRGRNNNTWGAWKRIDGADWSEVRNKPTVSRRDYSRTIQGTNPNWDSGNTKNISVTGFVEVYPDGSVEQYFYFRNFRIHWFNFEKQVGGQFRLPEIPVQLWTAMPNKISWVEAHLSRTNDTNISSERTIGAEAAEWTTPSWAFEKQNGVKDRVNLYTRRLAGDTDETVDMMVKVRGY